MEHRSSAAKVFLNRKAMPHGSRYRNARACCSLHARRRGSSRGPRRTQPSNASTHHAAGIGTVTRSHTFCSAAHPGGVETYRCGAIDLSLGPSLRLLRRCVPQNHAGSGVAFTNPNALISKRGFAATAFMACPMNRWYTISARTFRSGRSSRIWATERAFAPFAMECRSTPRWVHSNRRHPHGDALRRPRSRSDHLSDAQ